MKIVGEEEESVELLTALQPGAIAVLQVRGPASMHKLEQLIGGPLGAQGVLAYRTLRWAGQWLDEVLVFRLGPQAAELHVSGSLALVDEVRSRLRVTSSPGQPLQSLEQAAYADAALAPSESGARVLLDQAQGALRRAIAGLLQDEPCAAIQRARELLEGARCLDFALRPRRVLLAGPANAGKSTLFNLLVGEERALVTADPGTTRDALIEPARLGTWPVMLVDSAGLRDLDASQASMQVEALGQARARSLAREADLILWLSVDAAPSALEPALGQRTIELRSQADRWARAPEGSAMISALAWPDHARGVVAQLYRDHFGLSATAWEPGRGVPFRAEHIQLCEAFLREPSQMLARRALQELLLSGNIARGLPLS